VSREYVILLGTFSSFSFLVLNISGRSQIFYGENFPFFLLNFKDELVRDIKYSDYVVASDSLR
jgi:hypothetical protein